MGLTIELTARQEILLSAAARIKGVQREELAAELLTDRLSEFETDDPAPTLPEEAIPGPDAGNAATMALMQSWLEEDATDDAEELRQAEEELEEFKRNMNAPRKEVGARLLFPEVE